MCERRTVFWKRQQLTGRFRNGAEHCVELDSHILSILTFCLARYRLLPIALSRPHAVQRFASRFVVNYKCQLVPTKGHFLTDFSLIKIHVLPTKGWTCRRAKLTWRMNKMNNRCGGVPSGGRSPGDGERENREGRERAVIRWYLLLKFSVGAFR